MRTHRETPWLWRSLALVACSLPASACVDAYVGKVDVCEYEGKDYKLHDKFQAADGCNTCTCEIDGSVACTERACDGSPAMCDEKYGCPTDASIPSKPDCDPKYGCPTDAGSPTGAGSCEYLGTSYKEGEFFLTKDGCNNCGCYGAMGIQCTDKVCYEPDGSVAPGTCEYSGYLYKIGEGFAAKDGCNKCTCTEKGVVACSQFACPDDPGAGMPVPNDAGVCGEFSCPTGKGSCTYGGKTYNVGEGFGRGDNCNKCLCVADGTIECSAATCMTPGCVIGNTTLISYGDSITCSDGCNTCTCNPGGNLSGTERACPELPLVTRCDAASTALAFPAPLAYQANEAVAVTDSRCVNGQANDYTLCFDDLTATMGTEALLYVVAGSGTRQCAGKQRVFDLKNVREAYQAFTGQMAGKLVLRGSDQSFVYQFGF